MDVLKVATEIVKTLTDQGYIAYFAGGWVRDYVMEHPSADIDIATNAPIEKILDLFPRTIHVGLAFGVVIVVEKGHQFEVSTFRRDINYVGGRRPQKIEAASPQEDAYRRDFTINGMFYDPLNHVIHDYVHGVEDIKRRVIRTIGDPYERFYEDRLRMIRAVRFAARFGFAIDPDTEIAISENAETLFPSVAIERVWQEFYKMSAYLTFDYAIIEMHRLKLLQVIFPDLKSVHLKEIKKRVATFSSFPRDTPLIIYLMELFLNIQTEKVEDLCRYMNRTRKDIKVGIFMLQSKELIEAERHQSRIIPTDEWVRFYAHPHHELCLKVYAAHLEIKEGKNFLERHRRRISAIQHHIDRMVNKNPLVTSKHLKQHGIGPGKRMGNILKEAEKLAINHDYHDPEVVIAHLKKMPVWNV